MWKDWQERIREREKRDRDRDWQRDRATCPQSYLASWRHSGWATSPLSRSWRKPRWFSTLHDGRKPPHIAHRAQNGGEFAQLAYFLPNPFALHLCIRMPTSFIPFWGDTSSWFILWPATPANPFGASRIYKAALSPGAGPRKVPYWTRFRQRPHHVPLFHTLRAKTR